MATKEKTAGSKPAKAATPKKTTAKRKLNKGQTVACEVCGTAVTIDQIGDLVIEEDTILLCCGKPMKEKTSAKKAVKKIAKK